ncbi:hypothetical protein HYU18_01570 [Candidatus Woesearchaeota archaeon]|nr:hypothetical protein [Candidatus Woesearchaeota archaeon]
MVQITTVKLTRKTKAALDELKGERETYDEVIGKLASQAKGKSIEAELVEEYKELSKEDLDLLSEWEAASSELE